MIDQEPQQQNNEQPREPTKFEVATMIADTLGETEFRPRSSIAQVVRILGRTQSKKLLGQALQIESNGGEMLGDGSRKRTLGGIWFRLAYQTGIPKPGMHLPPQRYQKTPKKAKSTDAQTSTPNATNFTQKPKKAIAESQRAIAFQWEDRVPAVQEATTERGKVSTVKITVTGRPGKIVDKGQCIVTVMEDSKTPSLPKGLPTPTSTHVKYAVYISMKHWNKVKDAIQDPEDILIIEGCPKTDSEVSAIAVFATNVTTKKLQMAAKSPKAEVKQ